MFARLLLLFTLVPIIELALLIWVGQRIGTWPTVGIVLATGLLGAWLARREGVRAWREVRGAVGGGRMPAEAMLQALLILVGGTLLLTPGVLTDLLGFALLLPPSRAGIARIVRRRLEARVMRSTGRIEARFWTRE